MVKENAYAKININYSGGPNISTRSLIVEEGAGKVRTRQRKMCVWKKVTNAMLLVLNMERGGLETVNVEGPRI